MSDPIKFIFIVTADTGTGTFVEAASKRTMELCRRFYKKRGPGGVLPAPAVLRFVHFDCENNKINVFDFSLSTTDTPRPPTDMVGKWTALADFVASGDPRFSPALFVDSFGPFTILNIYHSIRGTPTKSVLELSIFSHGWAEGPIIRDGANDNNPPAKINGLPMRRGADTDGRARTDFADNMGEDPNLFKPAVTSPPDPGQFPRTGGKDALKEFRDAFDPQASFYIFGCNGQDPVREPVHNQLVCMLKSSAGQVIHQAYILPTQAKEGKLKNDAAKIGAVLSTGNVPATLQVPIDMDFELVDERNDTDKNGFYTIFDAVDRAKDKEIRKEKHYGLDHEPTGFFPAPTSSQLKFTREWSRVLGFVARRAQETYAFKAASALCINNLCIDVIAGPVGTLSIVMEAKEDKQQTVCGLGVAKGRPTECARIVYFHEHFMRTSPSVKSERRYFVYDPDTVKHINTLALIH